ncbi:hypothetical protein [Geminocystis herdmanii]|uniref:hypothetical protein n=1 Tax=Geminocystis herdmanii TaxID=669359 RepID=UPI0003709A1A|nr:hypothetical protein [Geminocystis herdmanii]
MKTYYLPLNYENLSHYYSSALICSANCYQNRIHDIQSNFNAILISQCKWIKDCDCSLELIIDTEDENFLVETEEKDLKLLSKPLPISRIKTIWFTSKENQENISYKINKGTAFLPDFLFQIEEPSNFSEINFESQNQEIAPEDYSNNISKFDNLLGGISLMRSVCQEVNVADFLSFVSNINSEISSDFEKLKAKKILKDGFNYSGLLTDSERDDWKLIQKEIKHKPLSIEELKRVAEEKQIHLEIGGLKNKIQNLDNLVEHNRELYLLCFLAQYGSNDKPYTSETLLREILENKFQYIEQIALVFGLYNGYKSFRNEYKFDDIDANLKVKFELNSKMDYYLIESAYQRTFNKKQLSKVAIFSYLDEWLPKFENQSQDDSYDYYKILDTVIYTQKRTEFLSDEYSNSIYTKDLEKIFKNLYTRIKGYLLELLDFFPLKKNKIEDAIDENAILKNITDILEPLLKEWFFNIINNKLKDDFIEEKERQKNQIKSDYEKKIEELNNEIIHCKNNSYMKEDDNIRKENTKNKLNKEELLNTNTDKTINNVESKNSDSSFDFYKLTYEELKNLAKQHLNINKKDFDSKQLIDIIDTINQLKEFSENNPKINFNK